MGSNAIITEARKFACTWARIEMDTAPAVASIPAFTSAFGFRPEAVHKVTKAIVLLGRSVRYSRRCANHLAKNGTCDTTGTGKMKGRHAIDGVEAVSDKDSNQSYLIAHFASTSRPQVQYFDPNGNAIPLATIKPFIKVSGGNAPVIRTPKLENVVGIKLGGKWVR